MNNKIPTPPPSSGSDDEQNNAGTNGEASSNNISQESTSSQSQNIPPQSQNVSDGGNVAPPPPPVNNDAREGSGTNNLSSSSFGNSATPGIEVSNTSLSNKSSNKTIWIIAGVAIGIIGLVLLVIFFRPFHFGSKFGGGKINISHKGDGKVVGLRVGRNKHNSMDDEENYDNREEVAISQGLSGNCLDKYNKLLEINGFDFDKYCINQNIRSQNYQEQKIKTKPQNIVLIFDASGSMGARIGGQRKIDIAKEATKKFIDQIAGDENTNLDIIVYGHKGSNSASQKTVSCNGIEEIYHLGGVHADVVKSKLDNFNATGWTPIADSLKKAQQILAGHKDEHNFILLVSDGKETCGGNPVGVINNIKSSGTNIKVNVIGFDVTGDDADQLEAIAEAGDGNYFDAKNAYDMEIAFQKHRQMLNKADFKIGSTVEQLYDISFVINTYNQCRVMLYKEYVAMMLDIHAHKLAGTKCEKTLDAKYRERFENIKNKIETNYQTDKAKFNALQ